MFYPELLKIFKDKQNVLSIELIDRIDNWLAFLPDEYSDKITVSKFSNVFNIDYSLSRAILERLCELKVFIHKFAILCPECNHILKLTDEQNLIEDMLNVKLCYNCDCEDISIETENIEVRYKLIKVPDDPKKMKNVCEDILGKEYVGEQDSIKKLMEDGGFNNNNLFYNPTEEQYKTLELLFRGIDQQFINTTDKGNILEDLAKELLKLVKCFRTTPARTSTNQIDVLVINKAPIPFTLLEKVGNVFYCECKNEEKKPDNNYFHKLSSILTSSRCNPEEYRLGVVFSKKECTTTCYMIAEKKYYKENLFLVNFDLEDLKEIVYDKVNFLDFLNYKIDLIEKDLKPSMEIKYAYIK